MTLMEMLLVEILLHFLPLEVVGTTKHCSHALTLSCVLTPSSSHAPPSHLVKRSLPKFTLTLISPFFLR